MNSTAAVLFIVNSTAEVLFIPKKKCLSPSSFKTLAIIKYRFIYCLSSLTSIAVESSDGVVSHFCYSCQSLLLPIDSTSTSILNIPDITPILR